ncbi:MAG: type IV secretion system protein [Asticcacaulis sp.]|uniref:type IV secretion system protein n=1 Tax=Asticcacaulis sp. TaxID=1872648 RepID=UPI0039E39543
MQIGYCPAISLVGETSVSGSLYAMDCHINAAVEIGYNRLFGSGGVFGYALTAMLIVYVGLLAIGFLTGRTRLTVMMMSPRIMTMVLVLTFVSYWPAYHAVFYGLMMGGPDEVAAALLGQRGSAVMNFAQSLDNLFVHFAEIAKKLDPAYGVNANNPGNVVTTTAQQTLILPHSMPVTLFWLSGLCLLVSTLGVLILTRLVLYLLLILGPVFIIFALFPQTRGLFNGWLRTTFVFALSPLLTVLGGTAALMLFVPLIEAIGNDPTAAVNSVQPMVILFIGSVIYCAFLFTLMWVAASLVRDWQAALREKPASDLPMMSMTGQGTQAAIWQTAGVNALRGGMTVPASDAYARTDPMVTAISRSADVAAGVTGGTASRTETLGLYDPQGRQGGADRFSRVQGLGQRFRNPSVMPNLTTPSPRTGPKGTDL